MLVQSMFIMWVCTCLVLYYVCEGRLIWMCAWQDVSMWRMRSWRTWWTRPLERSTSPSSSPCLERSSKVSSCLYGLVNRIPIPSSIWGKEFLGRYSSMQHRVQRLRILQRALHLQASTGVKWEWAFIYRRYTCSDWKTNTSCVNQLSLILSLKQIEEATKAVLYTSRH